MPTRLQTLKKAEAVGAVQIRNVLLRARDKIDLLIIKNVKKKNFISAAFIRDYLYIDMGKEYAKLNGKVSTWQRARTNSIARQWRKFAIEDLPKGSYNQTWATFSKKYVEEMDK